MIVRTAMVCAVMAGFLMAGPAVADTVGTVSWYSMGKRTANGERYNRHAFTAASRGLPFGTLVRVTRLDTGRSVIVRINDRGPWVRGRILDLSEAAGRALGLGRTGIARARVKVVRYD